jgi:hypothetical protein
VAHGLRGDNLAALQLGATTKQTENKHMSKLKTATIPDHHKVQAKIILNEAIDEQPDTVIVLCFWKDKGQFKIKSSTASDRLMVIGALEEAKSKFILDGYA